MLKEKKKRKLGRLWKPSAGTANSVWSLGSVGRLSSKKPCMRCSSLGGGRGAGRELLAEGTAWSNAELEAQGTKKCLARSELSN